MSAKNRLKLSDITKEIISLLEEDSQFKIVLFPFSNVNEINKYYPSLTSNSIGICPVSIEYGTDINLTVRYILLVTGTRMTGSLEEGSYDTMDLIDNIVGILDNRFLFEDESDNEEYQVTLQVQGNVEPVEIERNIVSYRMAILMENN